MRRLGRRLVHCPPACGNLQYPLQPPATGPAGAGLNLWIVVGAPVAPYDAFKPPGMHRCGRTGGTEGVASRGGAR
ncbi:hypothetical protein EMIT0111MI5_70347 [Burkholderia sp. IT-111MI5]